MESHLEMVGVNITIKHIYENVDLFYHICNLFFQYFFVVRGLLLVFIDIGHSIENLPIDILSLHSLLLI